MGGILKKNSDCKMSFVFQQTE